MNGYNVYLRYIAVKTHFTTKKYDIIAANGAVKATQASFEKRRDKVVFEKIAHRYKTDSEVVQFFVANFAYGNGYVVYSPESHYNFNEWSKRKESISNVFENDLIRIEDELEEMPDANPIMILNGIPLLLKYHMGNKVTYETMVILQNMLDYLSTWESKVLLWQNNFLRIRKGGSLVKYDADRIQKIFAKSQFGFACGKTLLY